MSKIKLVCALLVMFLVVPSRILAEDDHREEPIKLDAVVVTASRTAQETRKIPANITVITREDIEKSNAQNITDVLKYESGVTVRDLLGNGKTAQVDVRGFGETGQFNTLVLVDGRRVNEIDISGTDWSQIPLEQVERIEILRGSGSVLYGDGAVGGVVNIITRTTTDQFQATAGVSVGSYNMHKEEVSIGGGTENLYGSIYGISQSTEGYRDDNAFIKKDFGGKIVFDASDALSLRLSGSSHEDKFDLPGALTRAQKHIDREMNVNQADKGETEDAYIMFGADLDFNQFGMLTLDVSYRDRWSMSEYPEPLFIGPFRGEIDSNTWSIAPRYVLDSKILSHPNKLIAGVDFSRTDYQTESFGSWFIPITTLTGISDNQRESIAAYLHDEFELLDNLILTVGARKEKANYDLKTLDLTGFFLPLDDSTSESQEAWEIGLTWLYADRSSAFFRANRSYRFPLLDELVFWNFPGITIKDLEPQVGKHLELGFRHALTRHIQVGATVYHSEITDEIFYNPLAGFFGENVNHPATIHEGIEIVADASLCKFFSVYGNYSYESAKLDKAPFDGNRIPGVPRHRANIGLRLHDLYPGLAATADYNYVGSRYAISDWGNDNGKVDAYYTLDVKLSYKYKNWEAFAGINNLTNQTYSDYVVESAAGTLNYYPAPERNWIAGVKFTY